MITTLFFVQLIGFQLFYITSKQIKHNCTKGYFIYILGYKQRFRNMGLALILMPFIFFVAHWGLMTGLCAGLVGIMGVGSLIILIQPFHYVNEKSLIALYVSFLFLECFI